MRTYLSLQQQVRVHPSSLNFNLLGPENFRGFHIADEVDTV